MVTQPGEQSPNRSFLQTSVAVLCSLYNYYVYVLCSDSSEISCS